MIKVNASILEDDGETYIYFLGFLKQDGSIYDTTRNRGNLSIEISSRDADILYKMKNLNKGYLRERVRDTNFKEKYHSITLSFHQKQFRDRVKLDLESNKYENHIIFMRGEFDADGSCGFISCKGNPPFLNITLTNDKDYYKWKKFIEENTDNTVNVNPNKRDGVRNVMIKNESAQKLLSLIYKNSTIHLNRKHSLFQKIIRWERPKNLAKASPRKFWTKEQDNFILNNTVYKSMEKLQRTEKSIRTRLSRINKGVEWC